jgi:hypothetical protein
MGLYVALSLLVWWHLWSLGPTGALPPGSLDPAADVWWLAWVPHALGSGANPLFTRAMYHPAGVNLLANTSFLALGLLLAPLTVLAGPLASFTVAVVLAPAADALAAYAAFRRFVSWPPAAFAGGLLYGFGPFVATDLRYGHLNLTVAVVAPLALVVMERILRPTGGVPWGWGLALAACVVVEFFLSLEMLALGVVVAACATVVVAGRGRRRPLRLAPSAKAMAAAALVSAAVLAYPTWWFLRGPRHFRGAVWGDMTGFAASLASFVQPHGQLAGVSFISGGNGDFLGVALLGVLVVGTLLGRDDRRLCFATAMVGVCAVLALGAELHVGGRSTGVPMPAWPLLHLPLLSSAAASRFGLYLDLFAGLSLALAAGRLRQALGAQGGRRGAAALALSTCALALAPAAWVAPWPYPVRHLEEPAVLSALDALPAGTVVREYPLASGTNGDGLVWQAEAGLRYSVTAGYAIVPGRGGRATISSPPDAMGLVFAAASLGRLEHADLGALVPVVRAHAFDDGVEALAVVTSSRGGAELETLLGAALGRPAMEDGSGALWLAPGLGGCRPLSAGGAGPGCAARGGA